MPKLRDPNRHGCVVMKAWCRSGVWKHCRRCKTTDRKHFGRGYCEKCYYVVRYAENIDTEHKRRKVARLNAPVEKNQAVYAQQRAWKDRNRERALASQKAHYERNKAILNRWPIGATVWVWSRHALRQGAIIARENKLRVTVQLVDGTQVSIGVRSDNSIHKEKPVKLPKGYAELTASIERMANDRATIDAMVKANEHLKAAAEKLGRDLRALCIEARRRAVTP